MPGKRNSLLKAGLICCILALLIALGCAIAATVLKYWSSANDHTTYTGLWESCNQAGLGGQPNQVCDSDAYKLRGASDVCENLFQWVRAFSIIGCVFLFLAICVLIVTFIKNNKIFLFVAICLVVYAFIACTGAWAFYLSYDLLNECNNDPAGRNYSWSFGLMCAASGLCLIALCLLYCACCCALFRKKKEEPELEVVPVQDQYHKGMAPATTPDEHYNYPTVYEDYQPRTAYEVPPPVVTQVYAQPPPPLGGSPTRGIYAAPTYDYPAPVAAHSPAPVNSIAHHEQPGATYLGSDVVAGKSPIPGEDEFYPGIQLGADEHGRQVLGVDYYDVTDTMGAGQRRAIAGAAGH